MVTTFWWLSCLARNNYLIFINSLNNSDEVLNQRHLYKTGLISGRVVESGTLAKMWCRWAKCYQSHYIVAQYTIYRVSHKFSYTWNKLFLVNWFISKFFWGNTKWKKVSTPNYLKILIKLSKHGISYSLKRDSRSISKITFNANLSVIPIYIKL